MAGVTQRAPALFSADNPAWCTPRPIWEPIAEHFGGIGLDPCSSIYSQVPARNYLWEDDDALAYLWQGLGLVYCNPPYGRQVTQWVSHGLDQPIEIIYLLPSRTDLGWYQRGVRECDATLLWKGRLTFEYASAGAPFPSVLFYRGPRVGVFTRAFSGRGEFIYGCSSTTTSNRDAAARTAHSHTA